MKLIDGITSVRVGVTSRDFDVSTRLNQILNKYIGQGKAGLIHCQSELIDHGLEEYAKL